MAVVITVQGKKINYKPQRGKFTIQEISEYLDGLVEPTFIGNNWVFVNKNGIQLRLPYNQYASAIMGFNIYGLCLIVPQEELPCQFFLNDKNNELLDKQDIDELFEYTEPNYYIKNINYNEFDNNENKEDLYTKFQNDEIEKNKLDILYYSAYKNLIEKHVPFNKLIKKFIIFDDGINIIDVPTTESQIKILDKMITYFSEKEEYEKCIEILKLKNYIGKQNDKRN